MSTSAEVNIDLSPKENALPTSTPQVTLETACEPCKSPRTPPLHWQHRKEIQLHDPSVSTNWKKCFLFSQMQHLNHRRSKPLGRRAAVTRKRSVCKRPVFWENAFKWQIKGVNPSEIQLLPKKQRLQWVADISGWQKGVLKKWHEVCCCNKKSPLLAMLWRVPGICQRYWGL